MSASADRRRIAVVGGGIAGITAAHVLQRAHDVTIYEAGASLGGHAHTVHVPVGRAEVALDTAFVIYNRLHYPRFVELISDLGVEPLTQAVEMSASFCNYDQDFHYALDRGAGGLLYQRRNLVRPAFHRLLVDLFRFRRRAHADMEAGSIPVDVTLGRYLEPYSSGFRDNFVLPLATAVWSLPGDRILEYPARAILQFFVNHRLLEGRSGRAWRSFRKGSEGYVQAFARAFAGSVRTDCPVRGIRRRATGVRLRTDDGVHDFDDVVLATHADTSLRLLGEPTPLENELLSPWRYHANQVIVHRDRSLVHPDRRLWSTWNMVTRGGQMVVSYHLNRIHQCLGDEDYFTTLGTAPVDPALELGRFNYHHPVFDATSVATQPRLPALNGRDHTYFCGSYFGHGFHEDAVDAALGVARCFGLHLRTSTSGGARAEDVGGAAPRTVRRSRAVETLLR